MLNSFLGALRLYFERYGAVETVTLICDSSNKSKGYGFVTFEDPNSIKEVLSKIHVVDLRQVKNRCNFAYIQFY